MPNHIRERIASLREVIKEGLHQENLDKITQECNALSQDTSYVLSFFVLKKLFSEISEALDGEAVTVGRHTDLVSGMAESSIRILDKIVDNDPTELGDLESIVSTHTMHAAQHEFGAAANKALVFIAPLDEFRVSRCLFSLICLRVINFQSFTATNAPFAPQASP